MKTKLTSALTILFLTGLFVLSTLQPVEASPRVSRSLAYPQQDELTGTPAPANVTPADIINAVNNLRVSRGLNALIVSDVLMQVAADQANALAASEGTVGHERPCGMTLGQDLLSRGFPLLGDLSMDGYRSENWVTAYTMEDAMSFWMGDAEHLDTMVDPNRSHIGAAVAASDQVYMVLETAFSTSSGQMQYDAYPILTGIPQTQAACYGMYTEAAKNGLLPQDMLPVYRNTALPGGEVIHEVKYGQTLWTLAIQYGTTIAEIKRLNRLSSDVIAPGMKLLILTGATQPPPDPRTPSPTPVPTRTFPWAVASPATPSATAAPATPSGATAVPAGEFVRENSVVIVALVISFSVLLAGLGVMGRKRT
jgi:uncharacterized protein YkwD